jgi:hypothetical protein
MVMFGVFLSSILCVVIYIENNDSGFTIFWVKYIKSLKFGFFVLKMAFFFVLVAFHANNWTNSLLGSPDSVRVSCDRNLLILATYITAQHFLGTRRIHH